MAIRVAATGASRSRPPLASPGVPALYIQPNPKLHLKYPTATFIDRLFASLR
jgi:hypothetical protein